MRNDFDEKGNRNRTITRYEIKKCDSADFETEYEKNIISGSANYYCIDDPGKNLSTIGTWEGYLKNKTYSSFKLKIDTCNDNNQNTSVNCSNS